MATGGDRIPLWLVGLCAAVGAIVGGAVPILSGLTAALPVLGIVIVGAAIGTVAPTALTAAWRHALAPRRTLAELVIEIRELRADLSRSATDSSAKTKSRSSGAPGDPLRRMSLADVEELDGVTNVRAEADLLLAVCPTDMRGRVPSDLEANIGFWENRAFHSLVKRPEFQKYIRTELVLNNSLHPLCQRINQRVEVLDRAIAYLTRP